MAFVARGEVFVASTDFKTTRAITNTPQQERGVSFHKDGRTLLYTAERDGVWGLYETSISHDDEPYFFTDNFSQHPNNRYKTNGIRCVIISDEENTLASADTMIQTFTRDFYAFEQHVRAARKLRGLEMNPDWYKIAIFYFSNPNCCYGHKEQIPYPKNTTELDFELEFAIIIGNGGSDIEASDANKVIAGYTILNDWSSRNLQREEMPMSLGPAKGKDFASSFGPYMVTPDELENDWDDHGKLNLRMTCHVNGNLISDGNTNDLYHSFGDMIERASMNTKLVPGEYIGSGTVGTGCILELRPENTGGWIKKGDSVRLEIEKLGALENRII